MMKKYMMTVAASLMVAGNLFAVEEVMVIVDHQHTHGVQEHKHTHEVVVNKGPTFDEMVKSAESTIWPGAWTGLIDGAAQGAVAIAKYKVDQLENTNMYKQSKDVYQFSNGYIVKFDPKEMGAVTVDALASIAEDVWRNNPNQFSQREEGKASSYLVEKIVHNMFKFAVGLATIEAHGFFKDNKEGAELGYANPTMKMHSGKDFGFSGAQSKVILAQKALFIEGYINTLCRDRKIIGGTISKGILNALLRGITEGVVVNGTVEAQTISFNADRAAAVVVAIIVGEGIAKILSKNSKSRSAKRFERILTNALTGIAKSSITSAHKGSCELNGAVNYMTGVHGLAIVTGLTGLAWLSQHRYTQNFIGFLADVTALVAHARARK